MPISTTINRERVVQLCHALSDETRLKLLELLAEGEQCVCDLTDALKTGQSRLSFHLKTLKEAGLLQDRREGRWVYYSLEPAALEELKELLQSIKARSRTAVRVIDQCK
ncbi:MAG: transcriptional regulator [Nitrospirae bacterium RIFCSPLOWO2_12_FULL_63_8]|nr:MAG: transcriptional regulator [Nitrospirae bacterium RIFCSPLOWO2_12_FULL_63_8]